MLTSSLKSVDELLVSPIFRELGDAIATVQAHKQVAVPFAIDSEMVGAQIILIDTPTFAVRSILVRGLLGLGALPQVPLVTMSTAVRECFAGTQLLHARQLFAHPL
jgi:hypothetical protein